MNLDKKFMEMQYFLFLLQGQFTFLTFCVSLTTLLKTYSSLNPSLAQNIKKINKIFE